jgi:hypothetical protein
MHRSSLSVDTQPEIRSLAQWIKEELHNEYNRRLPERAQKTMVESQPPLISSSFSADGPGHSRCDRQEQ